MLTVLVPVAVIALIVIIGVIAFQRGREGVDLSPQAMLRAYLYVGSFAGVIALAFGLSALLNGALASVVGNQIVYGGTPVPQTAIQRVCPVGVTCPPEPDLAQVTERQRQENDRRRQEDLLRGATFTLFGALFYGAHRAARRSMHPRNVTVGGHTAVHDGLQRAYHLLGTVVFGIGAIALLPAGLYQLLANSLLTLPGDFFRQGVADTLTGGVVSTVLWLLYLRAVLADTRGGDTMFHRSGPSGPPAEPTPVGARIGPGPGERYAGAEAQPPRERD
ncbi:MAG TPA: hypothetical protein VFQ66_02925 [Candidatus Limnocylindria bacterium]|nr:hypothetical protein [Candidatus Limnocylindria bacterium]